MLLDWPGVEKWDSCSLVDTLVSLFHSGSEENKTTDCLYCLMATSLSFPVVWLLCLLWNIKVSKLVDASETMSTTVG